MATTIKINGVDRTVDVDGDTPLLWVLREQVGLTGELRFVAHEERRIAEEQKFGLATVLGPPAAEEVGGPAPA